MGEIMGGPEDDDSMMMLHHTLRSLERFIRIPKTAAKGEPKPPAESE